MTQSGGTGGGGGGCRKDLFLSNSLEFPKKCVCVWGGGGGGAEAPSAPPPPRAL